MVIELAEQGLRVDQQRSYPVTYRGHFVGQLVPDLVVEDAVIVDLKVAVAFSESHLAQMSGYLAISRLRLALLLNFEFAKLQWKRVVQ